MHTFGDVPPEDGIQGGPPSHRSCQVFHNKDGLIMSSETHFGKVGSKHFLNTRCVPELSKNRRKLYKDPSADLRSEPWTTTSHQVGLFYHYPAMKQSYAKRVEGQHYTWDHDFSQTTPREGRRPGFGASARSSSMASVRSSRSYVSSRSTGGRSAP
jgi:hypothetical protein